MAFRPNKSFRQIIEDLGLTTGLQLCLDAGDAASYTSGQSWLDRAQGYDFFLGTTSGVDASDPTFNGVAGDLKETTYWSFDGGDFFTYDSANEVWMNTFHKDNAKLTVAGWVFYPALGVGPALAGTSGAVATNNGFIFGKTVANTLVFVAANSTGSPALNTTSALTFTATGWHFIAISLDEAVGAGGLIFQIDALQETQSSTYTAPAAGNASFTMQVAAQGNAINPMQNTGRLGAVMMWNRALSAAELMSLYQYPGLVFSDLGGPRSQTRMVSY